MKNTWTKENVHLLLARFYKTPRLNSQSEAVAWDLYNQSTKEPNYPTSTEIMEILEASEWSDVRKMAKANMLEWQQKLGKVSIRKDLQVKLNQLHYIEYLKPHREYVSSTSKYKAFREVNPELELPSINSVIFTFGTWAKFKKEFGFEDASQGRRNVYTKEELIQLLDNYTKQFPLSEWNSHAKELNLPYMHTLDKYLTKEELAPYLKNGYHRDTDNLIEIAWEYREPFSQLSVRKWDNYAKENKLPSKRTFINHWGKELHHKVVSYLSKTDVSHEEYVELFTIE